MTQNDATLVHLFAHANKRNDEIKYTLSGGDLSTLARHASFLKEHGFDVGFNDIYPGFKTREEKERALRLLYEHRIDGWMCYKTDLIEYGICTAEEFETNRAELRARKRDRKGGSPHEKTEFGRRFA